MQRLIEACDSQRKEKVQVRVLTVKEVEFLEFCLSDERRTRSHKTARLVAKGGLSMPLVARVWGVTSPPWGLAFTRVCHLAGRAAEDLN